MMRTQAAPHAALTRLIVRVAAVIALGAALALAPAAHARDRSAAAANYIVTYERNVENVDHETNQQEDERGFRAHLRFRRVLKGFAARLTPAQAAALRAAPDVASVQVDEPVHADGAVPLAAGEPLPPAGIRRIGAATPKTARQSSDAAVAVLDTGVDLSHPDLNAVEGVNCITPGDSAEDDHGHGTHVAGVIGARNDGAGVVGVAPGTRIYAVKVMNANGVGTQSQMICGIEWVTAHAESLNLRVANMSFGSRGTDDGECGRVDGSAMHAAICRMTAAGVVPVASAGNDGVDYGSGRVAVPAAFPEVVTVTAMSDVDGEPGAKKRRTCQPRESDDRLASFSNFAVRPEDRAHTVAAPGVCVRSTYPGGEYATMNGTSAAAPHVAGIAALCFGEGRAAGPCAGRTGTQAAARVIEDVNALASVRRSGSGFAGDPLSAPSAQAYYGFIARLAPDSVAPDTTIAHGSRAGATSSFSLSSPDAGVRFECRIDARRWSACAPRYVAHGLVPGVHRLRVRAVDAAGNADPSPALRSFRTAARRSARR